MKLLVLLSLLIPAASMASQIKMMSDTSLENLSQFAHAYEKDSGIFHPASQYVSVIKSLAAERSLTGLIQNLRTETGGEYSRPAHVNINQLHNKNEVENAVYALFSYQNRFTQKQQEFWQDEWMKQINAIKVKHHLHLAVDKNSFGGCRSLVFEDLEHKEILVIGNCYSE